MPVYDHNSAILYPTNVHEKANVSCLFFRKPRYHAYLSDYDFLDPFWQNNERGHYPGAKGSRASKPNQRIDTLDRPIIGQLLSLNLVYKFLRIEPAT